MYKAFAAFTLDLLCVLALVILGCETIPVSTPTVPDASIRDSLVDSGTVAVDAGAVVADTGVWPDAATPPPVDAGSGPVACAPALSLTGVRGAVVAFDLLSLAAAGGTGAYRFELTTNSSGGLVNPISGEYVSGGVRGVEDTITVTDLGCIGQATLTVRIVRAMQVQPARVELATNAAFTYEVLGGSGQFSFNITSGGARGTITPTGRYTAIDREGRDLVEVTDTGTLETIEVQVDVVANPRLVARPARLIVAVGQRYIPDIVGGSGHNVFISNNAAAEYRDGAIWGVQAGRANFSVSDRFTGLSTPLRVDVVAPHTFTATRSGDYFYMGWVEAAGDLNGDGFLDAVAGIGEADVGAHNSGAVFVYRGIAGGLDPTPAQVITMSERESRFGRTLRVADLDGDGQRDLVVGAERMSIGASLSGSVFIYRGLAGGFFEDSPSTTLSSPIANDHFGYAIAVCDFNADGRLDIASSANEAEDLAQTPRTNTQGAVSVFLGRQTGFAPDPDVQVYGLVPDGQGGLTGFADLRLGFHIDAGDVDGDGACDLVASTYYYRGEVGGTRNGLVEVFRGVAASASDIGGIQTQPAIGFASGLAGQADNQMGRFIAVGDLDGDGRADIAASEYLHDGPGGSNTGAVRVFSGRQLSDAPLSQFVPSDQADFIYEGLQQDDNFGWFVRIEDATGDRQPDLLTGNFRDEIPGESPGNAGTITIFEGRVGALPEPVPTATVAGSSGEERFGSEFGVIGDLDGDGLPEMIAYAALEDVLGRDVGRMVLIYGDRSKPRVPLEYPGAPAGYFAGRGLAVVGDVNGDGQPDLLAGAPLADSFARGVNSGAGYLYLGQPGGGFEAQPALELVDFNGYSGGDQLGWRVAPAGDFNGDGTADFAMVSRYDDRPGNFNANIYAPDGTCTGTGNNRGSIYIWLGNPNGLPSTEPAFVHYGPQENQTIRTVAGGFDWNNDGFDDVVASALDWDSPGQVNAGGYVVIEGRPATDGRITVICNPARYVRGVAANDYLGRSMTGAGDIDGDGCDEFVVGAPLEDLGSSNQGTVHVIFGGGVGCSSLAPQRVVLAPISANAQSGFAVAAGLDADGDNVPDILVGGPQYRAAGVIVGAAWLVSGAYVAGLPREAVTDFAPGQIHPYVDPADPLPRIIEGPPGNGWLGAGVALVPSSGRALIAVGSMYGSFSGVAGSGGAQIYQFGPMGIDPTPTAAFGGETTGPVPEMGRWMTAGRVGGRGALVVGGTYGSGVGLELGAFYTFTP